MFGDYEIAAVAGRGGMGVVYKALHVRLRRFDALKLLRADLSREPGFVERFRREATLAASIKRHENVVIIYDWGVRDDRCFLVMEWVDGEDLRSVLDRDGPLAPAAAVAIVLQTAHALEAVHAKVVHRDVKPANILVTGNVEAPHVILTDFGIARPTTKGETITQPGAALGTPGYLSPEQATGRGVDRRSDLYALGCVFFEAISGRPVFSADNEDALEYAHAHNTLPSLAPVLGSPYEPFDRFLTKALAIDPDKRYGSAEEFASALEAAAEEWAAGSGTAPSGRPDAKTYPRTRRPTPSTAKAEDHGDREEEGLGAAVTAFSARLAGRPLAYSVVLLAVIGVAVGMLVANEGSSGGKPPLDPGPTHGWHKAVPLDSPGSSPMGSSPVAGVDSSNVVYAFWKGTNGVLWEEWDIAGDWNGPEQIRAAGDGFASQPAVAVHVGGEQDVFWRGTDGDLREISHTNAGWQKPIKLASGHLGSAPTAGADANLGVYVFWRGINGTLWDKWTAGAGWKGPDQIRAAGDALGSQPAVAVRAGGEQDVFWRGTDGNLWEASRTTAWQKAVPVASGPLESAPTAGVDANNVVYVYWQGPNGTLWETWNVRGHWNRPIQILTAGHGLASQPAVAVQAGGNQDVFWQGADGNLWETSYVN